jgi:hypothetical protein
MAINDKTWRGNETRVGRCPELDAFFNNTKTTDVKPSYKDLFFGIKDFYFKMEYISNSQANSAKMCIRKHHSRGISARSFRGIPRTVYDGIY